jgi:asparagine synthase (glutamine-hydrolysing)
MVDFAGVMNLEDGSSEGSDVLKRMMSCGGAGKARVFESGNLSVAKIDSNGFEDNDGKLFVTDGFLTNWNGNASDVGALDGFFSFLSWDGGSKRLVVAEDGSGTNPVYYAVADGKLIFGNDIKFVISHPDVKVEEDFNGINEMLTLASVAGDGTLFKGVRRVSPGCMLEAAGDGFRKTRYWDISPQPAKDLSDARAVLDLIERNTVKFVEDGENVGVFLSGGIDSSMIVDVLSRRTDADVSTFTVAYDDDTDESGYAGQIVEKYGTKHKVMVVKSKDMMPAVTKVVWDVGNDTHVFLMAIKAAMFGMVGKGMKVFKGNGADENFDTPTSMSYLERMRHFPATGFGAFRLFNPSFLPYKARKFIEFQKAGTELEKLTTLTSWLDGWERREIYGRGYKDAYNVFGNLGGCEARIRSFPSFYEKRQYLLLRTFESNHLMNMNARLMSGRGILAYPYLSPDLVQSCFKIPPQLKFSKGILKRCSKGLLPENIAHREKLGFGNAMRKMVAEQWDTVEDCVFGLAKRKYFSEEGLKRVLKRRRSSDVYFERKTFSYDNRAVDALFGLEVWFRTFIDQNRPKPLKRL